jgi:hypothetical protein
MRYGDDRGRHRSPLRPIGREQEAKQAKGTVGRRPARKCKFIVGTVPGRIAGPVARPILTDELSFLPEAGRNSAGPSASWTRSRRRASSSASRGKSCARRSDDTEARYAPTRRPSMTWGAARFAHTISDEPEGHCRPWRRSMAGTTHGPFTAHCYRNPEYLSRLLSHLQRKSKSRRRPDMAVRHRGK